MYVDVTIKGSLGSKTLKMPADTGSSYIVLDPGIIKELGLLRLHTLWS